MSELSKTELELIAEVLDAAANEFSNHGCNDFPLEPTEENKQFLIRMIKETSSKEDAEEEIEALNKPHKTFFSKKECYMTYDWLLMRYLAKRCKEIIKDKKEEL